MPLPAFAPTRTTPRPHTVNRTMAAARLEVNGPAIDKLMRAGLLSTPIQAAEVDRLAGREWLEVIAGELTVLRTDARDIADPAKMPSTDTRALVGFHVDHSDTELIDSSLRWWRADAGRVLENVLFTVTVATIPVGVYALHALAGTHQRPGEKWLRYHFNGTLLARMHRGQTISYAENTSADLRALARTIMSSRVSASSGGPLAYLEPRGPALATEDDAEDDDMQARGIDDDSGYGEDSYFAHAMSKDD